MKRTFIWLMLVACITLVAAPFQAQAATKSVNIVIDDKPLSLTNSPNPFVEKGRTLVPVRGVFEQLGLDVSWDQKTNTATITGDDVKIVMKSGSKQVTVNGTQTTIDVPVLKKDNRLFIPLRFVSEEAGIDVKWDQGTNTVYLSTAPKGTLIEDTDSFLETLIEKNSELNSFAADMDIEQEMTFFGETIKMDMSLLMEFVVDPLGMYQHLVMNMEELEGLEISMEAYLTKDGYYMYDSDSDQWIVYDDAIDVDELESLIDVQLDPQAQFELMDKFIEDLDVYEFDNTYELHFNISNASFQELLDFVLSSMPELGLENEFEELGIDFNIEEMTIISTIDKETYYPISDKITTNITITAEGEEITLKQNAVSSYSKYNEIDEIVIPQEVIDSAITFEEYLEQLDFDYDELEEEAA